MINSTMIINSMIINSTVIIKFRSTPMVHVLDHDRHHRSENHPEFKPRRKARHRAVLKPNTGGGQSNRKGGQYGRN